MRRLITSLSIFSLIALLAGCDQRQPARAPGGPVAGPVDVGGGGDHGPAPKQLPKPPVAINEPKDLPADHNGTDLSKGDPDDLLAMARAAAKKSDYKLALAAQ